MNSTGSILYYEAITNAALEHAWLAGQHWRKVTGHESGHQFNCRDADGGIMTQGFVAIEDCIFLPASLVRIRAIPHP